MRYRLNKGLLALSSNASLLGVFRDPHSNVMGDFPGSGGLPQLRVDLTRQSKIKHTLVNSLTSSEAATHEDVRQYLEAEFPQCSQRLIDKYSQGPTYLVTGSLGGHSLATGLDTLIGQPDRNGKEDSRDFYFHRGCFYLKHTINRLPVLSKKKDGAIVGYIDGPIEVLFKESATGFEFEYLDTDNKWVCDWLMGYPYQDPESLNWLQRNSILFQPVYENTPIIPLRHRLYEAFHSTYSGEDIHQSDFAAFIGWPGNHNIYSIAEYALGGFILTPLKNTLKLVTEVAPFMLEVGAHWAIDKLKANFPNEKTISNPTLRYAAQAATAVTIGLLGIAYYAAKTTRLLLRTITSPITSFKEGWKTHPLLGIASATLTVAAVITISIFAAPVVLTVLGKIAGVKVASAVAASLGKVTSLPVFSQLSTVITPVVTAFAKFTGLTLPVASTVAASAGTLLYVAATPLKAATKAFAGWLYNRVVTQAIHKRLRLFQAALPAQQPAPGHLPSPKPKRQTSTTLIYSEVPPAPRHSPELIRSQGEESVERLRETKEEMPDPVSPPKKGDYPAQKIDYTPCRLT